MKPWHTSERPQHWEDANWYFFLVFQSGSKELSYPIPCVGSPHHPICWPSIPHSVNSDRSVSPRFIIASVGLAAASSATDVVT